MSSSGVSSIYNFPTEFVENLQVLHNGLLLLSTMKSPTGLLYTLDPTIPNPQARVVTTFGDNVTALTGIAPLPGCDDLYAVSGGLHTSFAFERGSMQVYVVSLKTGKIVDEIPVPDTATMNGMTALPRAPHILLSADSIQGRILAIDTRTHKVNVVMEDEILGPATNNLSSTVPSVGINGLRVRDSFVYFTDSGQGTFVRVHIDDSGRRIGNFEVLARSPDPTRIYDDFTFDHDGNAFVATHSTSVIKITPDGEQTVFVDGDPFLKEPTSVALANDGKSIFVTTGGNFTATPREGGRVVQIQLAG
ncbi:putative SMP-30/Gluconolactonase/LRE-like region domain-containing protein [Seiridium cardinale]